MRSQNRAQLRQWRLDAAMQSGGRSSEAIYSLILRSCRSVGSVLDWGAGAGELTRNLLCSGKFQRVTGIDITSRPSDLPIEAQWTSADLNENVDHCVGQDFDLVVIAETIEHLENPRSTLRAINQALRRGGEVILTTPNNESYRSIISLLIRGHFVSFNDSCYPAHITALLRKDIERIFAETGFGQPDFFYTDHGAIPGFPKKTWQSASLGLLRGLRFSDNLLARAQKM